MKRLNYNLLKPISIQRQRIAYGITDLACNLIWQVVSLYLLYFYTNVMKLHATDVSIMFLVTRILDGLNDFIIGYLIDKTNSIYGKSRPFLLIGAIPLMVFAYLCFTVPSFSYTGRLIYAYITYIGLCVGYTLVNIPMASILPSLTTDPRERTNLTSYRMFFSFVGATIVSSSALYLVNALGQGNQNIGYGRLMLLFGVIAFVILVFSFMNVREVKSIKSVDNVKMSTVIRSLSRNQPWIIFATNILFMFGGYFLQMGALIYYFTYVVGDVSMSVTIATVMTAIPIFANFFVPLLASKLGKRNLFLIASIVQICGIGLIGVVKSDQILIIIGAVITSLGHGLKQSVYFSMQADPVDYGEWKTGINASGSISAANSFLGQVAQAIAGWLAGVLLAWGNYDASIPVQSSETIFAINAMFIYIPLVLIICSTITMCFYNLDKQMPQIQRELVNEEE